MPYIHIPYLIDNMNPAQTHTSIKNSISTGFNNNYLCGNNLISVNFVHFEILVQ